MKLKFLNPDSLDKNIKATAHKSGKLGFTIEAAKKLNLSTEKTAGIAINEEDANDNSLYMIIYQDGRSEGFKINKAGGYYYINTKPLFDSLKIDYKNDWVVYDIYLETIDNQEVFKFKRRQRIKKDKSI